VPTFYEHFPSWFQTVFDSGISSAAVTAVLLNLLFNVGRRGTEREAALVAESPTVGVTPDYDVPGGTSPVPGALDSDDQGTVVAREYDAQHRREHRTPDDVWEGDRATRSSSGA
jgi:hypothetical protein